MSDPFYADGERYDRMYASHNQDLPFWLAQAAQYGDPILELTCGTGRVSIPLAQAGYRVTGVDVAPAMLQQARAKSEQAQVSVTWVAGDIRDFDLGTTFPLILFPANAICHLLDRPSFEACMTCIRRHLAREGRFVIDVFVPDAHVLTRDPQQRYPFEEYVESSGLTVVVTQNNTYRPDVQINQVTVYLRDPSGLEVAEQVPLRMYYPEELAALLHYNGFHVEKRYGDYSLTPFDQNAAKQLLVCTQRA